MRLPSPVTTDKAKSMERFLLGHSLASDRRRAVEECIYRIGPVPADANLGFLYATDTWAGDLPHILEHLKEATGIEHWVGTVGLGLCWTGVEHYETPGMTVMVAGFPTHSFRVFPTLKSGLGPLFTRQGDWCQEGSVRFGVVHGDPRNPRVPALVEQLAEALPDGFLVGGLTSSQDAHPQIADGVTAGGLSGVLFNDEVAVATALTQGCSPIGERHVITECDRHILIGIDGRAALDVFYEEVGEILARDPSRIAGYIFAAFPVPGSDTGDYLVRNLVGIDTRHKLLAVGDTLQPGTPIMFCHRDASNAWGDLQRMLRDLAKRMRRRPRGALYYSCLGRGRHLFGEASEELKLIQHELGDVPLVGFFTNGEICHNRLYGYTGVLAVFC